MVNVHEFKIGRDICHVLTCDRAISGYVESVQNFRMYIV